MRLRAFLLPYSIGASVALGLCMPFLSAGCGSQACLQLTAAEAASGKCPSATMAFPRFSDPNCPGMISSVDGEGSLEGMLCCYPVSKDSSSEFPGGCVIPGGEGGFTSGGGGTGGFGGGPCDTCSELTQGLMVALDNLCPNSASALMDLTACVCNDMSPCNTSCSDNLCQSQIFSQSCLSCLFGDSTCSASFGECESN